MKVVTVSQKYLFMGPHSSAADLNQMKTHDRLIRSVDYVRTARWIRLSDLATDTSSDNHALE